MLIALAESGENAGTCGDRELLEDAAVRYPW